MSAIASRLPSPAMIVACVALVVALGGVSYAATVLPKNSVGTSQVQKKAITASKLHKNAVNGLKVKNGSLMAADFKAGQLPAGPRGPKGDAGTPGVSGYQVVYGAIVSVPAGQFGAAFADCPAGKKAVGGGGGSEGDAPIVLMQPYQNHDWAVAVRNDGNGAEGVAAIAYCVNIN